MVYTVVHSGHLPIKHTPLFPREFTGKEWSQFLGRWPLCTTVGLECEIFLRASDSFATYGAMQTSFD